jgi:hypothetical protein
MVGQLRRVGITEIFVDGSFVEYKPKGIVKIVEGGESA